MHAGAGNELDVLVAMNFGFTFAQYCGFFM